MQLLLNIIYSGFLYLSIAFSFSIIYNTYKFLNITYASFITLSPYFYFLILNQLSHSAFIAFPITLFVIVLINLVLDKIIYQPFIKNKVDSFILLIITLGLYIIFENLISLVWGNESKSLHFNTVKKGNEIFGAILSNIQLVTIFFGAFTAITYYCILNKTILGMQIRAISSNSELAQTKGINFWEISKYSVIISSFTAATIGILVAYDTNLTPNMGFNFLIYGIVVMIIGGAESTLGIIGGSLLLATAQHFGAYYIDSKWMDAIAYILLIIFLIFKPLGFSGKRLKKVEI